MSFKLGLCSISFRKNTPQEILAAMKTAGLTVIEWGSDVHCPPEKAKEIAELQKQYHLYIVSNCQDGYIQTFFHCNPQLEKYFVDFECPGRTCKGKGENIKLVVERNSLDKAVYVGDTQGDCDASDFAGVPFIHAAYGFGKINREVPKITAFEQVVEAADEILE